MRDPRRALARHDHTDAAAAYAAFLRDLHDTLRKAGSGGQR